MARLRFSGQRVLHDPLSLGETTTLGRSADVDIQVDEEAVSRKHARIEKRAEGFFLVDLKSTNGTWFNDQRIEEAVPLQPGDRIRVGSETFEFIDDSETPTRQADPGVRERASQSTLPLDLAVSSRDFENTSDLPRRVGKFLLLRVLGKGGMGKIYLARDLDSARQVAVKFIRSQVEQRESFLELFHNREAALARQIDHPNVIGIHEHGVQGEVHYISMEYARGPNLLQVMKKRMLKPGLILEVVRQVACGLAAAHRQGVIHSDIKPANILLVSPPAGDSPRNGAPAGGIHETAAESILDFDRDTPADREVAIDETDAEPAPRYEDALMAEVRRRIRIEPDEALLDPLFFDRPSELRFLDHFLGKLAKGRGQFVLVRGEAGLGKDRLISEFLRRTAESSREIPIRFLELDGSRVEGIPSLHASFFEERTTAADPSPDMARRLAEAIPKTKTPIILRILGFGSIQPQAFQLVSCLASRMDESPVLLLANLSPQEVSDHRPLKDLLATLQPWIKELYLRPLTPYQLERFLMMLFRDSTMGPELPRDVYRLSRGNFTKLLAILRDFFKRKLLTLDRVSGRPSYRPNTRQVELEEGKNLHENFQKRSKVEQGVLEQAAFIGNLFLFDTLLRVSKLDETLLFFILKNVVGDGFLTEEERTWYRFSNTSFQLYLADRTPEHKRPALHRKISKYLQSAPVASSASLQMSRAQHYAGCHEHGKAVNSLLEAAFAAQNGYQSEIVQQAYHEILSVYRRLRESDIARRRIVETLKQWFRRDGNWYEILGKLASEERAPLVKIADFGISFRLESTGTEVQIGDGPRMGTPRYMAPERVRGEQGGPRSDIFSLGVLLYEMVVGQPPFPDLKRADVMRANLKRQIRIPAENLEALPDGFGPLSEGMLAQDPANRWDAEHVIREIVKIQFESNG